jgi:arylsulfatase A-like enzyme
VAELAGTFSPLVWVFRLRRFDRDVGLVLAAYALLLAFENVAIGLGYRADFAGSWEMASARMYLSPIGLALVIPFAIALVALERLAGARREWGVAIVGALGCAALAIGVSSGRLLAPVFLRVPFVTILTSAGFGVSWMLARWLPRAPARIVCALGVSVAVLAWTTDAFVLARLYPPFHLALFFVVLGGVGIAVGLVRRSPFARPVALLAILVAAASVAWAPDAAQRVRGEDNLRRVLLEHAPMLGRSVVVASRLAPPPPIDDDRTAATTLSNLRDRGGARVLDWRGHDLVVVTIDALRADHVSAYGYPRQTTPNIDRLAARGVRFEHAYCPTPHTSYSIASMMTGKYMKPLLALDTEDESETWAVQLRRYGYRTAAFYPPAVFYIDEHRFRDLREQTLGFEYAKEEFATPALRKAQIESYLQGAPADKPVFLWVHLFEPHEPYEMHPEHPFSGDPRVDAYDSEVATADDLVGEIADLIVTYRPPGAVFMVSADHGEEHGDHGGRYHGTTVYEEQVRVPLVVVAPGLTPHVVKAPVQTIDLLPTSLAALDVPIPPRLRGRDLGPAIAGVEPVSEEGLAFAETDDYTLLARGADRLLCVRKIGSCTLFDVARDPREKEPVSDRAPRVTELRKLTAELERETGKLEASALPDALRRGLHGDRDAAEDVAPLLDDVRVDIRRATARCAFHLKAPVMIPQLHRAAQRDEDGDVRQWSALALVRLGESAGIPVESLLKSTDAEQRAAAALALAERGDGRGEPELVARWTTAFAPNAAEPGELSEARELLEAMAKVRARTAAPVLVRSLADVRLRPHIVETLAELGDARGKEPLLRVFSEERYVHLRPLEARALLRLGMRERLEAVLTRFAGTPEPMTEAIALAREARILGLQRAGREWVRLPPDRTVAPTSAEARLRLAKAGPARLFVLVAGPGPLSASVNGAALAQKEPTDGVVYVLEVGDLPAGDAKVSLTSPGGIVAAWLVPHAEEIPPPPPQAWRPRDVEPAAPRAVDGGL